MMEINKEEAKRIHNRLVEIEKEITKLGQDYISALPKPIPLAKLIKSMDPWVEAERAVRNLKDNLSELPF